MKMVIVESPGKISKIQKILGNDYVVKASVGHITELAKGGYANTGVNLTNFKAKYVISEDKRSVYSDLLETAKKADVIYLCTDPDREGESISWHLYERLFTVDKPFKRARFKELTKPAITKAIKNAGDIDMSLVESQEARRILDRIVGFRVSPFLMKVYENKLSAGRVQSVATRLICEREKEIKSFVPEDFFNVYAQINHPDKKFTVKLEGKFKTKTDASDCVSIVSSGKFLTVKQVSSDKKKENTKPPLITATLQQVMSKKFGYSADDTMKAAQSLYEKGVITYLRTDSVRAEPEAIKACRDYLKDNNLPISSKEIIHNNKNATQDAHECIRPTDPSADIETGFLLSDLTDKEKTVYDTIRKYFLASQCSPAIFDTLKITFKDASGGYTFKVTGKCLTDPGYLSIFGSTTDSIDLPNLKVGDTFDISDSCSFEQKKTQPPARYSESDLLSELESKEIGRPATYANILQTITSRNYVEKKGNTYYGTDLGLEVTNKLNKYFKFMDYEFTAKMEKDLDDIAHAKSNKVEMLSAFLNELNSNLNSAYTDCGFDICEKCGNMLIERTSSKDGSKFKGCSGYPHCTFVQKG